MVPESVYNALKKSLDSHMTHALKLSVFSEAASTDYMDSDFMTRSWA